MKRNALIFFLHILIFISCKKNELRIDPENLLPGIWNYSGYQDNVSIFTRSNELIDNHGYNFSKDGTFIERENTGWCGTPPIIYDDYDGIWSQVNDTLIKVNVGYWGGQTKYSLDIESITETYLKVVYLPNNK
jgi:hypothetical protein